MRRPVMRFTVRRLMVAVAIAGLSLGGILGGYRLILRHLQFRSLAGQHAHNAEFLRGHRDDLTGSGTGSFTNLSDSITLFIYTFNSTSEAQRIINSIKDKERVIAWWDRLISYHASMARKYEHAARCPWLQVEPDPPEPTL